MVIDHQHNPHLGGHHVKLDVQKGLRKADECGHGGMVMQTSYVYIQCDHGDLALTRFRTNGTTILALNQEFVPWSPCMSPKTRMIPDASPPSGPCCASRNSSTTSELSSTTTSTTTTTAASAETARRRRPGSSGAAWRRRRPRR